MGNQTEYFTNTAISKIDLVMGKRNNTIIAHALAAAVRKVLRELDEETIKSLKDEEENSNSNVGSNTNLEVNIDSNVEE